MDIIYSNYATFKTGIVMRDKGICQSCKNRYRIDDLSAHHIISRLNGGTNHIDNGITLCCACHDETEGLNLNKDQIINWYHCRPPKESYKKISLFISKYSIPLQMPFKKVTVSKQIITQKPIYRGLIPKGWTKNEKIERPKPYIMKHTIIIHKSPL